MKCKNIECDNETVNKRVYCSLTCRNVYVNKYLRNYNKVIKTWEIKKEKNEENYLLDPKLCKECNEIIPFDKKGHTFCDKSCSASSNNRGNIRSGESRKKTSESIKKHIKQNGKFGCLLLTDRTYKRSRIYPKEIKVCDNCKENYSNKNKYFCSRECRKKYGRKDVTEYQKYKADTNFKFSLNSYPNEFDFSLIEKYGWYSPTNKNDNLGGVSRDHILSVMEGFELGIDPFLLAHPANCKLMIHNDNVSKHKRSDLTEEELKVKIEEFDKRN
jgi:hypothetical protein